MPQSCSKTLLKNYFGFDDFRLGQQQVVDSILTGKSAAAIFPTGSGKSLCYQLPATQLPGLTLVISPLLALMQDQLEFLGRKNINAASIDSSMTREQTNSVMEGIRHKNIRVLMISVERLNNERFRRFISDIDISMMVVDEAHCISEWGHNFRPDYLKLPQYQKDLNIPQTLLLTATATSQVVEDMGSKFGISTQDIVLAGFYRENLALSVQGVTNQQKISTLISWLNSRKHQAGIVYVTLQQTAEQVATTLKSSGFAAQAYHAGMDSDLRQKIQDRFMSSDQGVIVATIAFGMGIDKSNIRFVAHYDLPKSIENYAQEIGRAGRDGLPAECLVLANRENLNILENFVYGDTPDKKAIDFVLCEISKSLEGTSNKVWELMLTSLSSQSNIRQLTLKTLLVYLELSNVIEPRYSYFAEYKYKLTGDEETLLERFEGERRLFLQAILQTSDHARVWKTLNLSALNQTYPCDRNRVITALEYLSQENMIELQSKQMTQVYQIIPDHIDAENLSQSLFQRFSDKEQSEIGRVHQLMSFFETNQCLSSQLAQYFSDHDAPSNCGHCSVCAGKPATLPQPRQLSTLDSFNFTELSSDIRNKLGEECSSTILSRFFCGLTSPLFSRLRVRSLRGFAALEHYHFSDVRSWVTAHLEREIV